MATAPTDCASPVPEYWPTSPKFHRRLAPKELDDYSIRQKKISENENIPIQLLNCAFLKKNPHSPYRVDSNGLYRKIKPIKNETSIIITSYFIENILPWIIAFSIVSAFCVVIGCLPKMAPNLFTKLV